MNLLSVHNLGKSYGERVLFEGLSFGLNRGDKVALIANNGTGKSSMLKILSGQDVADTGEVVFRNSCRVSYLQQDTMFNDNLTIDELIKSTHNKISLLVKEYEEAIENHSKIGNSNTEKIVEELTLRMDQENAWDYQLRTEQVLSRFNINNFNQKVGDLSGGQKKRLSLALLLLESTDILLLDEPTNHLDIAMIEWLEKYLQQSNITVLMVTHDRYFLDNVAGWILELDRGEGIPWKGNYSSWLEQKGKRLKEEEKSESKRQKVLARELEWVRMNPKARQAKSKARLANYDKMMSEDIKQKEVNLEIPIPNGPRLGTNVIEASNVQKSFGDKMLYDNLNFKLPPAGIVGIVGPNGAGKTTIFKMIMNELLPDHGTFSIGETVKLGYVDQTHKEITPEKTVFDVVSNGLDFIEIGKQKFNSRAYLSKFNFSGSDQNKKVGVLSGGERNRLHLAMTLKTEANVLLLDEPTNDIDVNTLRALEEGIQNFAGCAVVISHDRWFLDRICTHIIAFEGDSQVYSFEGSYSDYEENKRKRLGDVGPKRIKYRKLTK